MRQIVFTIIGCMAIIGTFALINNNNDQFIPKVGEKCISNSEDPFEPIDTVLVLDVKNGYIQYRELTGIWKNEITSHKRAVFGMLYKRIR